MSEIKKLLEDKLNGLSPLELEVIKLRVFREFAKELFELWDFEGDIDGGDFQDLAVKHGLLVSETRITPCHKEDDTYYCSCAEYHGCDESVTCYRYAALLRDG
jgi:hypothetical protein